MSEEIEKDEEHFEHWISAFSNPKQLLGPYLSIFSRGNAEDLKFGYSPKVKELIVLVNEVLNE